MEATQTFTGHAAIELRLRELNQLFEALDPAPLHERDLSRSTQDYIVQSLAKLPKQSPDAIVIYLDQTSEPATEQAAVNAVHAFFARRAQRRRWELRQLFRRGFVSLAIGLGFLVTFWGIEQLASRWLRDDPSGFLLRESLIIGGWVAMWRPVQIFLYDWWPLLGQRRLNDRLSRIQVRIVPSLSLLSDTQT